MKIKTLGIMGAAALALAACETLPEGVTEENVAAYDVAVASIGCDMVGESDYTAVEFQTGMTRQQVLEVTQMKLSREQAVRLPEGGVRLTGGGCAA